MAKQFSRRSFLKNTGLVTAASVLASCAPAVQQPQTPTQATAPQETVPTEAPAAAAESVPLQYWVAWSGKYANTWDILKETPEYKDIVGDKIDLTVKGSMYGEQFLTAIAAGTPPDLGSTDTATLGYMSRGIFLDIGNFVATSKIIKKEDFIQSNWEGGFYKGVQYGVPANECFVRYALCYNGRMVEKAGLDPKVPPETWSEVLNWHEKLTQFDDAGNLTQIGLDPYDSIGGSMNPIDGFFAGDSWGFKYFDEGTGKFDLDNEKMAEIFDTYAEFYKVAGPDKMGSMRAVEGHGTWGGSYFAEVQAMVIDGYWHCGWTADANPEVAEASYYTWAPVTDARKGVKMQYPGGHYVTIFKDSKHFNEAFKISEFLQTKSACDILFDNFGFLPARPSYLKTANRARYPGLDFYFNSVDEATEIEKQIPCVISSFVELQFRTLGESVYRGQMDSKAAAAEMQRLSTEEWKRTGLA
jgi:multiple sugar transport system substrate-binding protein